MTNEEKAKAAATQWCRCYKCDGIVRNLISENSPAVTFNCDKDKLKTCLKWYNGYRTAEMALSMKESIDEEKLDRLAEQANPYPAYDKSDTCVAHSHDGFNEGFIEGYRAAL